MKVQKILTTLLALTLLMTSCSSGNSDSTDGNGGGNSANTETDAGTGTNDSSNTDGNTNEENSGGDSDSGDGENAQPNEDTGASPVDKVESAEDGISFIDANVYSLCGEVLPMMVETRVLSGDDMDAITYNTGLTDTSGINDIILSESMVGSFAYSLVYLRTDGTNTAELQTALGESVNPAKWVCVNAEAISSVVLDNDIILVMGEKNQVDAIINAVITAAEGVYENVGSVVNVG